MVTPTYNHLKPLDWDMIYEPAEDTFLLIDSIEKDLSIINNITPLISLEIGSGSGVVITFLSQHLMQPSLCLASDVNSFAALSTLKTSEENNANVQVTVDSLVNSFIPRLRGKVDVLLFNPPYVVTPSEEVSTDGLSASWAGGKDGREVIDKFLPLAVDLLSRNGLLYLVLIEENKPNEVMKIMKQNGYSASVIMSRKAGPESLSVTRFSALQK